MGLNGVASLKRLAVVPLIGGILAAGEEEKMVKVKDLPLYDAPKQPELIYVDERISPIRPYISAVRKVIWKYAIATKNTTDKVKSGFVASKKFTGDTLEWVREDKAVLQRAGIITVAGLGGLIVAGRRGGILRTTAYAGTSMVVTAAVVYPKQAVDITARNWDKVKQEAKSMWSQATSPSPVLPPVAPAPSKSVEEVPVPVAVVEEPVAPVDGGDLKSDALVTALPLEKDIKVELDSESSSISKEEISQDFGMSKDEDKDMYSTRE